MTQGLQASVNKIHTEERNDFIMSIIDSNSQVPVGLGMKLALDMKAMTNFANLSDQKKQEVVDYIKSSPTGDEAKNRVSEVVNNLHEGNSFR